jgi:diguanylate cyclase
MSEDADKIAEMHAERIMGLLTAGAIPPTPANYEVLYKYVLGKDAQLVREIDLALAKNGKLSSTVLDRIRREVLGDSANEAQKARYASLSELYDATEVQLSQLGSYIEGAGGDAQSFRTALTTGSDFLAKAEKVVDQNRLIQQIMAATSAMIDKTQKLESQLAMSRQEISSLRRDLDRAKQESRTDALTGLANRKAFFSYLEAQAGRMLADRKPLCLLFCDIDHFKAFNDTWGHRMGDEVLRLVGMSLEQLCHGIAYPARYGGEEFVVVLPGKDLQSACDIGEQFRDFVGSKTIRSKHSSQTVGRITMSIGIAQMRWRDTIEQLIERADMALYRAKETGRNRVCTEADLETAAPATALAS